MSKGKKVSARTRARELLVQALYQMQITDHDSRELFSQFKVRDEYQRVDQDYFDDALSVICENLATLEEGIDEFADRPIEQLDPVERGILLLGYHELQSVPDVPFRVVISEAVMLARRFGAEDGHKYVNAVLDRASKKLRPEDRN